jgi:uncharacterized protein with ACT and thioredoxin-like domain
MLLRVKLANHPGTLAKLLKVIADQGGTLGAIDLISSDSEHIIRELLVNFQDSRSMEEIRAIISDIPEIELLQVADRVFLRHVGGKIEVNSIRPISDRIDLSLVYTPGVGKISEMIAEDPDLAYTLTIKGNTVAIVTDGTAVWVCRDDGEILDALRAGQLALFVAVDRYAAEVDAEVRAFDADRRRFVEQLQPGRAAAPGHGSDG